MFKVHWHANWRPTNKYSDCSPDQQLWLCRAARELGWSKGSSGLWDNLVPTARGCWQLQGPQTPLVSQGGCWGSDNHMGKMSTAAQFPRLKIWILHLCFIFSLVNGTKTRLQDSPLPTQKLPTLKKYSQTTALIWDIMYRQRDIYH